MVKPNKPSADLDYYDFFSRCYFMNDLTNTIEEFDEK